VQHRALEDDMIAHTEQDRINRKAWSSRGAQRWFGGAQEWTDPGEAAAVAWVADAARGTPILDVGVGGGRTVPCMRALSDEYIAVDYMPEMVALCRANHPGVQVRQMDARDLSTFADNTFGLVMFSFNGIDAVDYLGRGQILAEFTRVLKPGGRMLFSTHNLHGPSYRENLTRFLRWPRWSANPIRVGVDCARVLGNLPIASFNYWRHSKLNQRHDGYAVRVCAAHKFGIVIVYSEMEAQQRTLAALGMRTEAVFGNLGPAPLRPDDDVSKVYWFHFIAVKDSAERQP
jgi:SAM-dependent methyltransferase